MVGELLEASGGIHFPRGLGDTVQEEGGSSAAARRMSASLNPPSASILGTPQCMMSWEPGEGPDQGGLGR
jgi:hypothetical protein